MKEEKDPSPEYIKGFNQGYFFKENLPELLDSLLSNQDNKNDRVKGMKAGKEQSEREQFLLRLKQEKEKQRDKGLERDY